MVTIGARGRRVFLVTILALGAGAGISAATEDEDATAVSGRDEQDQPPATFAVKGTGFWFNRKLRQQVELLKPEAGFGPRLDAAFVGDAVVLLQSALEREGFLKPTGIVRLELDGEPVEKLAWGGGEVPVPSRGLAVDHAIFELDPGVRYAFERLEFSGLSSIAPEVARAYFVQEGFIFGGASARKFSPSILDRGMASLQEELVRRGYADARVTLGSQQRSDTTGEVDVVVKVNEGALHRVAAVTPPEDAPPEATEALRQRAAGAAGERFSPIWRQGFMQSSRRVLYQAGYPEARVELVDNGQPDLRDGVMQHQLRLRVHPGPKVHVGDVRFSGDERTSPSILRRATHVEKGELFDRSEIDEDRLRLGRLGVFSSVRTEIDRVAPGTWDINYVLEPGELIETSLLLGYGSYERLRGGIEVQHTNLLGRAHRGRAQAIYSQKSISGEYLYTVPQVFGTSADVTARIFGLSREEVSFDREEFGASVGARRKIRKYDTDVGLRYQYESINADVFNPEGIDEAPTDSNVASLTLDLTRDQLNNPISPRSGHLLSLTLESAMKAIGGEVDYQRLDMQASWHRRIGRELYLHLGLRHGLLWALSGSAASDIPLARRFFPGGEGTIRGYTEGRASPRADDGTIIGAEVSSVINVEIEQSLARNLAAVLFVDTGLTAAELADYPGDELRVSVGIGLRYDTPIGPARLEYGYNVVQEDGDGSDAWHLALGFPF